jgi:glutamate synthase domain-containing protein 1
MCGILGYFRKNHAIDSKLGTTMLNMLQALGRRAVSIQVKSSGKATTTASASLSWIIT